MNISELFLLRYDPLYQFWLGSIWDIVSEELMRQRPDPRVNSIAWNLWHLTRAEDFGVNRFVAERSQILIAGDWTQKLNLPWRHSGNGMSFSEVDDFNQRIDLPALRAYSDAVQASTREVINLLPGLDLDASLKVEHVRMVVIDEGLAHSDAEGLIQNYTGWSKGKCLMTLGLTHSYQHVGEIDVIASLLGINFD